MRQLAGLGACKQFQASLLGRMLGNNSDSSESDAAILNWRKHCSRQKFSSPCSNNCVGTKGTDTGIQHSS
eukprot:9227062-Prorocentrum_lima.AAC.1